MHKIYQLKFNHDIYIEWKVVHLVTDIVLFIRLK